MANNLYPSHINYKDLGFKCGLEIHRRFKGKKLFCGCDAHAFDKNIKEEGRILRELRVSVSEEGEVDKAALSEFKKGKYFEYVYYEQGNCLVELDEQPPYPPNPELVKKALKISQILKCAIPNEIIFMRKIVVDGSNTSGFQRTALIGMNGKLNDKVGIETICLEEESAQILERSEKKDVYDLRRLGIGLIEIATTPTITDPQHAYKTAKQLGDLLKYSFYFQRGLGSIRQDLNISIQKGARVEIKGVQDLDLIPKIVEYEVMRQLSLLKFKELYSLKDEDFSDLEEISSVFEKSNSRLFKGKKVWMFYIKNAKGMFSLKLNPVQTLGNEVAGYVKATTKAKGFVHTDEDLSKYRIQQEVNNFIQQNPDHLYIFVIGEKAIAEDVRHAIKTRLLDFMKGVPEETRKALETGATSYLRPLPGAARMYPETDVLPIPVNESLLKQVESIPFKSYDSLRELLKNYISNEELLKQLLNSPYLEYVVDYFEDLKRHMEKAVKLLLSEVRGKEREYGFRFMDLLPHSHKVIKSHLDGSLTKEGVSLVLRELQHSNASLTSLLKKYHKKEVSEILKEVEGMDFKTAMKYVRDHYEGLVDMGEIAKYLRR
ncbi:MAG: Glu-tRNA(Gln) amidotransferase subunit GatE [Candidatus Nanohaloarchaeota archaeon]|nr:Glu-tRNA(Gln) amidotransferase subunit GatE [Candidatus Nanohaloarchaeota archaeon]